MSLLRCVRLRTTPFPPQGGKGECKIRMQNARGKFGLPKLSLGKSVKALTLVHQPNLLGRLPGRGPKQIFEEFESSCRVMFARLDATRMAFSHRRLQKCTCVELQHVCHHCLMNDEYSGSSHRGGTANQVIVVVCPALFLRKRRYDCLS